MFTLVMAENVVYLHQRKPIVEWISFLRKAVYRYIVICSLLIVSVFFFALVPLTKSIKSGNHKKLYYRLLSIFDINRSISIEKYQLQSILSIIEIIDW